MTEFNEDLLTIVPIHQFPEYLKQCCDLINDEWPRSETARMMSLTASCDKMPTSLILLTPDKKVIGHSKLTPIPSMKDSCFIESVVINKSLRGKGLGTFLMNGSEEYCKSVLSLSTIYLSTKGQELFYQKLGYKECKPVSIYGTYNQNIFSYKPNNNSVKLQNEITPKPPPFPSEKNNSKKHLKTYMVKSITKIES